jgi:hypothetical protein
MSSSAVVDPEWAQGGLAIGPPVLSTNVDKELLIMARQILRLLLPYFIDTQGF